MFTSPYEVRKGLLLTFLLIFFPPAPGTLEAQSTDKQLEKAYRLYRNADYSQASALYESLMGSVRLGDRHLLAAAESFRYARRLDLAATALDKLVESGKDDRGLLLLRARVLQHARQFTAAAQAYKDLFRLQKEKDPKRTGTEQEILRCLQGGRLKRLPANAIVEPLGSGLNTAGEEFAPLPSRLFPGRYYFSYRREADREAGIFAVEEVSGSWSPVKPLGSPFDGPGEKVLLDIISNGEGILFERTKAGRREVLSSLFSGGQGGEALPILLPLDLEAGDRDPCLFQDSVLMFSSRMPGGYGGYDLYMSAYREGSWTRPVNLGGRVNSPFDEINPSFAKDGQTIFFSSDNLESVGGYDIFRIRFQPEAAVWSERENMGLPINSAGDDLHFRMDRTGLSAVFSSDRWDKSMGGSDIFIAYFKEEQEEQLYEEAGTALTMLMNASAAEPEGRRPSAVKLQDSVPVFKIDWISSSDDDFMAGAAAKKNIAELARMFGRYGQLRVSVVGHSAESSNPQINLFTSVRKAGEMAAALTVAGIRKDRISIFGAGAGWPLATGMKGSVTNQPSNAWNNRVELFITQPQPNRIAVQYGEPRIVFTLKSGVLNDFSREMEGLHYALLMEESTRLPVRDFPQTTQRYFVESTEGRYSYYLGTFGLFSAAASFIGENGLPPGTRIRAFYNGQAIEDDSLINYADDFPDLILLIDYNKKLR